MPNKPAIAPPKKTPDANSWKKRIELERTAIEAESAALTRDSELLGVLGRKITALEIQYPEDGFIPDDVAAEHDELVDKHNKWLNGLKARAAKHQKRVETFNENVRKYNESLRP